VDPKFFKNFEDSAFYGKLTTTVMRFVLSELLGDIVEPEAEVEKGHADFLIKDFGYVEVTTSQSPGANNRRKWYRMSKVHKTWILVPKQLIGEYNRVLDLDFEVKLPPDLPPRDAKRNALQVVSFHEMFERIERTIGPEGLADRAQALIKGSSIPEFGRSIMDSWMRLFFGK
jgi:hypothetical protein